MRSNTALSPLVPHDVARGASEDYLAFLSFLWLADSQSVLEYAIMMAEQQQRIPLFALLLVADLFSGSGDTTWLYRTSPLGIILGSKTGLRRVSPVPGTQYVNGIVAGGRVWQYDMSGMPGALPVL